jgi:hypothetical protein
MQWHCQRSDTELIDSATKTGNTGMHAGKLLFDGEKQVCESEHPRDEQSIRSLI